MRLEPDKMTVNTRFMQPVLKYLDEKNIAKLKKALRTFYTSISADPKYTERNFYNNQQWEFFEGFFKKHAEKEVQEISTYLYEHHPEIKKSISAGEIFSLLHEGVFYRLAFGNIPLLVLTDHVEEGGKGKLTFEPRNITLKSALADTKEMDSVIGILDQGISQHVDFYKTHSCLASIEVANVRIDTDFEWEFAGVKFLPFKSERIKEYIKKVSPQADKMGWGLGLGREFRNVALIEFQNSSSYRAFSLSIDYFNNVFGIVRLLGALRLLGKGYWGTRNDLEIPSKQPGFLGSADNPMWSAINPQIDNDFFAATKENSVSSLMLSPENVASVDTYEHTPSILKLLDRAFKGESYKIDKKIFDSLSWFSDAQKNFIGVHKIVGFITALETLLTYGGLVDDRSDKGISEHFAERGAIILFDDYENRAVTKKKLKEIYGHRSTIVHGSSRQLGKSDDEMVILIQDVEKICAEIISKVISLTDGAGIKSLEELNSMVQKKLLS